MLRKNLMESRGRNLTNVDLNHPDRNIMNLVENKIRTHKKNANSENMALNFVLKSSNNSSVKNKRD